MDNASNALLIAGTILIALIILSMGVYLAMTNLRVGEAYNEKQIATEVLKYNNNFTALKDRKDITVQELVTLKKFAHEYSTKNGTPETEIYINGTLVSVDSDINKIAKKEVEEIKPKTPEVLSGNKARIYYYEFVEIKYDDDTGRINYIKLKPRSEIKS